jgi:hypothetical protein
MPSTSFGRTIIRNKNNDLKKKSLMYCTKGMLVSFLAVLLLLKKSLKSLIKSQFAK